MSSDQSFVIPGTGFVYSATPVTNLSSTEYTVVTIAVDVSGSVSGWIGGLKDCVKSIVAACQRSPRADYLLLRVVAFDHQLIEIHGYRELSAVKLTDYDKLRARGSTALYDAALDVFGSTADMGHKLRAEDLGANGIVFVITDGEDNASTFNAIRVGERLSEIRREESLESILAILVGVGAKNSSHLHTVLTSFSQTGCFDQYIDLDDANVKTLAKLAAFVSQSISSQSQQLGSGGPSQTIDPNSLSI